MNKEQLLNHLFQCNSVAVLQGGGGVRTPLAGAMLSSCNLHCSASAKKKVFQL